jgi:hypothetical protein
MESLSAGTGSTTSCEQSDYARVSPGSLHNFESIFLDHRIGQHFFGNALELRLRLFAAPTIEIQHKEFSLPYIADLVVAEPRQSVLDGLPLGIKNRALRHHPNMCFHKPNYNSCAAISGVFGIPCT